MMAAESHQPNGYAVQTAASPAPQTSANSDLGKEEVGWYFVERYYNTLSKNPEKLYLLYNKRSQFVAGVEEEKIHVSIGPKAIDDRVKELNYQDCKVRITNVDSQSSDANIVVQVIGEMTNEAKPHRKFCQTFVLAPQPLGWFLLNDILRFIADEEDEPVDAPVEGEQVDNHATDGQQAPPAADVTHDIPSAPVDVEPEHDGKADDTQAVNGRAEHETIPAAVKEAATEQDVPSQDAASTVDHKENEAVSEAPIAAALASPTKEVQPSTKAAASATALAAPTAAPSKPALPMSWAQRIGAGNNSKPAAPTAPAATNTAAASAPATKTSAVAAPVGKALAAAQLEPSNNAPARQASPASSAQDGSQGGWQTAGVDHSKIKSRGNAPGVESGHVRAYVKNVFQSVTTEALRAELSKYGELAYFDVSRQKNSAFVEFSSVEAFKACIADNPHQIGEDSIIVEERRPAPSFAHRGNNRGGRGGAFDGRQGSGRGGVANKDGGQPRAQFNGNRGNRGGANGMAGRGRPQAA